MTKKAIAYDLARLFIGPLSVTPRGIDRVELGYARQLFGSYAGDCFGVLPTPWGVRIFEREQINRGLDALESIWRETIDPSLDAVFTVVNQWLHGGDPLVGPMQSGPQEGWRAATLREWQLVRTTGIRLGRSAPRALPRSSVYVNCGQIGLSAPFLLSWLRIRRDIRVVFMLHDLIPIQHSQFVPRAAAAAHRRAVQSTVKHADAVIVPSLAMQPVVAAALKAGGRPDIPVTAVPLPVSPVFLKPALRRHASPQSPYFMMLGNYDPRKNHALILNIWKEMAQQRGRATPKLVIVGGRGINGDMSTILSAAHGELRNHVLPVSGLSTPALRELIRKAAAMLLPSFAEGFGLPIVEALSLGTPVIASNIPAHREAGGGFACLLDPNEPKEWIDAIDQFIDKTGALATARQDIRRFRPLDWESYFACVLQKALLC